MSVRKWAICPICGKDERGGGTWITPSNPMYTKTKTYHVPTKTKSAHGLCLILNEKRNKK